MNAQSVKTKKRVFTVKAGKFYEKLPNLCWQFDEDIHYFLPINASTWANIGSIFVESIF